jgi:sulfoxide reductase heme-binding subunit YedZ
MAFLRDRSGAWCPAKITAFVGTVLPAAWLLWRTWTDDLGPRPVTEAIHFTGDWTVRLMWITLAISPAARIFQFGRILLARRIVGVAVAAYVLLHLTLYVVDQKFKLGVVATEIALRFYLTIGFVAIIGLIALAATSTDGMVRRLGGSRWNRLHKLIYPIAILAEIHFLLQAKNDVYEPMLMLGFLCWLFGFRIVQRIYRQVTIPWLIALAVASGAITMITETLWYRALTGVDAQRIFLANFDFSYVIRPAWWVLGVGLAVALAAFLWGLRPQAKRPRRTSSTAASGATRVQSAN